MKPLKFVRIIIPDFEFAINNYINKTYPPGFTAGCELIMNFTQNWGHLSTWDQEFLTQMLGDAGFVNITVVDYGIDGRDKRLIKEESCRNGESIVIEEHKP